MGLKEDITFDSLGFVPPRIGQGESDNGVLYTSQYYILLRRLGLLASGDVADFNSKMSGILRDGNITRRPLAIDQEGPDDIIGLCAASKELKTAHAKVICAYGRSTFPPFLFNTAEPGKFTLRAWLGRMPGLSGFIKLCAGVSPLPWEWLGIWVGALLCARADKSETSNRLLTEMIVRQLPKDPVNRFVAYLWDSHIKKTYGGINGVVRIYFGDSHPFSAYWY